MSNSSRNQSLVLSYLTLRKAVGILGIALPFVLFLGAAFLFQTGLQRSMSNYYYTEMRDVFVGTMIAIGVFLFSYNGYERDGFYANLAAVFSIGIALFPTAPDQPVPNFNPIVGYLHLLFAAAFFLTLVYFSYFLFTKSDQTTLPTKKQQRNMVYKVCGVLIAICVLGMIIITLVPDDAPWLEMNPIFWLEAVAIWAFGISWFVKGEAIAMLNDKRRPSS